MGASKILRGLAWNAVLGIVTLLLLRATVLPDIPILGWPLLLAAVFGFPGTLVAVLLWVYVLNGA